MTDHAFRSELVVTASAAATHPPVDQMTPEERAHLGLPGEGEQQT